MNRLSLLAAAASATALLSAAPLQAQGLGVGVGADVSISIDTGAVTDTATGAVAGATATVDAAASAATSATVEAVTAARAAGQSVVVVSSDGQVLGTVEDAAAADGAVALRVALDPGLGLEPREVTVNGAASVDADGRVSLPMTQADFAAAVAAQAEASVD